MDNSGDAEFGQEDAYRVLRNKFRDEKDVVSRILSDIKREGLLRERVDISDRRVKIYRLIRK